MDALLPLTLERLHAALQQEHKTPSLGDFASLRDAVPGQYQNDSTGSSAAYDILDSLSGLLRVLEMYPPSDPRRQLAKLDRWLGQASVKMHVGKDYWPQRGINLLREKLGGVPQSPKWANPLHLELEENVSSPARSASSSRAHMISPRELFTPQHTAGECSAGLATASPATASPPAEHFAWSASMATGASER